MSRALSVTTVAVFAVLAHSACDASDDAPPDNGNAVVGASMAGAGGSAGKAGNATAGKAGSTNAGSAGTSAGKGGNASAGSAGSPNAGSAGSTNAGSAGKGGSASAGSAGSTNAGSAGASAGKGGAGSSGSANAGSGGAGTAGAAGATAEGLTDLVSASLYEQMFPNHDALFTYDGLVEAAKTFPKFGTEGTTDAQKREIAALFANIGHETTGGWPTAPGGAQAWGLFFKQEVGCEGGACTGYCEASNAQYPCAPGKTYHGRGPIQLSYNYNYGACGDALGVDLLHQPDLVTSSPTVTFRTALWFWMTPQLPKPSAHAVMTGQYAPSPQDTAAGRLGGFGLTIDVINGGVECGYPSPPQVTDRVAFYERFCTMLGVDAGPNLTCASMQPF